jgi:hypothetical protein
MRFFAVQRALCALPATVITRGARVVAQVNQALWRAKCPHKDTIPEDRMCRDLHAVIVDIEPERDDAVHDGRPETVG